MLICSGLCVCVMHACTRRGDALHALPRIYAFSKAKCQVFYKTKITGITHFVTLQ